MIYKEQNKDLFTVDKSYTLAHCVSGDFALGAGIAKEFAVRGVKEQLKATYTCVEVGDALLTETTGWRNEISLVTKRKYFEKPTIEALKQALVSLKDSCEMLSIDKIAMPRIGCGLDKLDWEEVSKLIKEVFEPTDIEILVCVL